MKQLYFKHFWHSIAILYSTSLIIFAIYPCRVSTISHTFLFDKAIHLLAYFFLPILLSVKIKEFWPLIILSFTFSLLTEFIQYLTKCGGVEFLDIISNLIGCGAGILFIIIFPNIIIKSDQLILKILKKKIEK